MRPELNYGTLSPMAWCSVMATLGARCANESCGAEWRPGTHPRVWLEQFELGTGQAYAMTYCETCGIERSMPKASAEPERLPRKRRSTSNATANTAEQEFEPKSNRIERDIA